MDVRIIPLVEAQLPDHGELTGSPTEHITEESFEVIRRLKCAWSDATVLASALIGRTMLQGSTIYFYVGHKIAWLISGSGQSVYIVAKDVFIEPFGRESQGALPTRGVYDYAMLTVTYRVCPTSDLRMLVEESIRPAAEFLTQAPEGFYWDNGQAQPLTIDEAPNRIVATMEYDYEVKWLPPSLVLNIANAMGYVNDASVDCLKYDWTFSAGTLLCLPPEVEPQITLLDENRVTLTMHFVYRPETWNKFYKHGVQAPAIIYDSGGFQVKVYPEADFSTLFLNEV